MRAARGCSLFYEVELRRTILSPAKWPGSIFETFPPGPCSPPPPASSSFFLLVYILSLSRSLSSPLATSVFRERHKFPAREVRRNDTQALVHLFFSISLSFPAHPRARSQTRKPYHGECNLIIARRTSQQTAMRFCHFQAREVKKKKKLYAPRINN